MAVRVYVYSAQARQAALEISTAQRLDIAEQAADIARSTAPVQTGEYQGGIGTSVSGTDVQLFDSDPEAGWKEFGTARTPAHFTLVNAARRFGRYSGNG